MSEQPKNQVLHGGAVRLPIRWKNAPLIPMTISRYRVSPGDTVSMHVHTGKAEYWVVLAGEGIMQLGEESLRVSEGDVIVTAPEVPHALHNSGADNLDFLNLVQPVGGVPITTREITS